MEALKAAGPVKSFRMLQRRYAVPCAASILTIIVAVFNYAYKSRPVSSTPLSERQCSAVFRSFDASAPATTWPPLCPLPDGALRAAFEGPDGSMPITLDYCRAQRYEGAEERVLQWTESFINDYCARVDRGEEVGSYAQPEVQLVRRALLGVAVRPGGSPGLAGSVGMVLGSERPWVECLALNAGAATVWTFEYGHIVSTHPRLKAQPVKEIAASIASGAQAQVDWVATFSSIEHSGLGRYGDALNPDGDREALQQAWCMLKPGGVLILGVPMACRHRGFIEFNSHRFYGFQRLAYIAADFEMVGMSGSCNPGEGAGSIVVLRKPILSSGWRRLTADDFAAAAALAGKA